VKIRDGIQYIVEFNDTAIDETTTTDEVWGYNSKMKIVAPYNPQEDYNKGLNYAKEVYVKLLDMKWCDVDTFFGKGKTLTDIINSYTPQEIDEYIENYEGKRIEVGDEVISKKSHLTYVVTNTDTKEHYILLSKRGGMSTGDVTDLIKTGRHYDIKDILEQIGDNEDTNRLCVPL
jgi:hypothetical protein